MYCQRVILEKQARFQAKYGWTPVEHSIEEVDRVNAHMKTLYFTDKKGDVVFDDSQLTKQLKRWIENERAMCAISFEYYLTRYHYISAENRIFRFKFRGGQRVLFSVIQDLEDRGVSIEIILLKARQGGFSTFIEALMTHRGLFVPGVKCAIGSANDQKTYVMMGMMYTALENLPWWLPPQQTKDKRSGSALLEFAHVGSQIVIQSGSIRGGIGQGTTPTAIHLCFSGHTSIRAGNGSVVTAQEAKAGMRAIAGDGTLVNISAANKSHRQDEQTAELMPWGCFEFQSTTLDHPILTEKGKIVAAELKRGDEVMFPVRRITDVWERSSVWHRGTGRTNKPPTEEVAYHNEYLGWVCGLYIAEGHLHVNGRLNDAVDSIVFTMHEREVARNMEGLNNVFGKLNLALRRRKDSKTCQIHVRSSGWARWINEHFGRVEHKRIPDYIWIMGEDFCHGLLRGYLEGDGHIPNGKAEIFATTIREGIAHQLRDLTLSLGFGWVSMYRRESGSFYNRNCAEAWTLMWSGEMASRMRQRYRWPNVQATTALHWRFNSDKTAVMVRLKKVQRGFSKDFYNIEVDHPDHTFCTSQMVVFNSEVCDYSDPTVQIEEGLFKAVHTGPEILMILESTGNGNTGWWADQWRDNKEFYFQGRSRLYPLFIPWFMTPELYPKKEWIEKFKIPEGWRPNPSTLGTIAKCEAYAHSSEALIRIIGKNWKMPREQQWFWEFNYEDAKRRRTEKSWLRHMPCDDYDALIGENDSVFDLDTIENIRSNRQKTVEAYGILGEGIAEKHDPLPEGVDPRAERILVSWKTLHEIRLEWVLMPLIGDPETPGYDPLKKLLIYEHPQKDALYSIGIDTGFGVGGDRTVIIVNRNGKDAIPDVQVAEFAADDITNVEVYAWAMAIAAYYGKFMEEGSTPRFVIEQRRKYGDSCYHALKLHGFRNHHHFREYDKRTMKPIAGVNAREGWWTNEWSRPLLLGTFKHAVENGWYEINSRFTLAEIEALEQIVGTTGKVRQDHRSGEHDDRIFAAAMAYFTFHDSDIMAERSKKKYSKVSDEGFDVDYSRWTLTVPNPGAESFFEQFQDA